MCPVPFPLPGQKGFQVFGNGLIQERLIRMAGMVGGGEAHASAEEACIPPFSRTGSTGLPSIAWLISPGCQTNTGRLSLSLLCRLCRDLM